VNGIQLIFWLEYLKLIIKGMILIIEIKLPGPNTFGMSNKISPVTGFQYISRVT